MSVTSTSYIVQCTCYTGGFHGKQSVLFFSVQMSLIIRGSLKFLACLCIVATNALWMRSQKISLKDLVGIYTVANIVSK